jgi:hypothetical protein
LDSAFYINAKSTSPDCANNIFEHNEIQFLDFQSSNLASKLKISIIREAVSTFIQISFDKLNYKTSIYSLPIVAPRPDYFDFNSISIQGKAYTNVRKVYKNYDIASPIFILYNREFGILKIILANGETFERIP